jgi:hypothetical protein
MVLTLPPIAAGKRQRIKVAPPCVALIGLFKVFCVIDVVIVLARIPSSALGPAMLRYCNCVNK